tara:strand:+ start:4288 stop:4851 length:564 start_codon:yes stop_codon:yes gene_type:complete
MISLFLILGGAARALVGTGKGPAWIGRWSVYPVIAFLAALVGLNDIPPETPLIYLSILYLYVVAVASLNIGRGYTDWEDGKWMVLRFGLPSILLTMPLMYYQYSLQNLLWYIILSVASGVFYPVRQKVFDLKVPYWYRWIEDEKNPEIVHREWSYYQPFHLPFKWWDSARLAEFIAGAAILGGLSIL